MKRHEALVQLSRDHHFGLLLCWKLKEGMKKDVETSRMEKYIHLFYHHNLKPHFAEEEDHYFEILGLEHPLILQAIEEHKIFEIMIKRGFTDYDEISKFRNLLEKHIRTEEREIFQEIQEKATDDQLENLLKLDAVAHREPEYEDEFWK